ncbi:MAG: DUF5777 family beta-barrel protein [Bacteroidales bacterium]|nr:DUF5777 family beta-barrel protein [Bacteroidales bacterium]MCF8343888.1 DUF5777 family beta-barrel protein [Bacteroidales bacterium]MCF8352668.1 DUF5777 family beta-barrel protein [Bacteroidales bacterium]MCF8377760.1 DUF5777 family beta-barrel protein [Bacteroidales bacterium]
MKKFILFILITLMSTGAILAQEEKKEDKPVRAPFESGILIDSRTVFNPVKKTLEFNIQHRFAQIEDFNNLYGIYGASNIRLALNYSVMDKLMIGFGTTKDQKLQDFQLKYVILEQTRENTIPVGLAFYGNMAIDGRNEDVFGLNYEFTNRFSYFAQLIISRKISYALSLQLAPSFSHVNAVLPGYEHDKIGISFNGRLRVSPQSSIIFNYDQPLEIEAIYENKEPALKPKANVALGWEISTSTHAFQIFISSARALVPQYNMMYNTNDFFDGGIFFGFNITRLWSF